jgi:hypothetical protein
VAVNATTSSGQLDDSGSAELELEAKFTTHNRILEKLQNHSTDSQKKEIEKLRTDISEKSSKILSSKKKNNSGNNNRISTTTFDAKEKAVESLIKNTEKNLKQKNIKTPSKNLLQKDILNDGKSDLEEAKSALLEARNKRDSGNLEGASNSLFNSRLKAENANISIQQSSKLGEERGKFQSNNKDESEN